MAARSVKARRRGARRLAVGIAIGVAAVAAVGLFAVMSPALANLRSETLERPETVVLSVDGSDADLAVPEGWTVMHPSFGDDRVTLRTPDGGVMIDVARVDGSGIEAFRSVDSPTLTSEVAETLGSGLVATHARGEDVIAVAVDTADGGAVTLVGRATGTRPLDDYLPTIAALLVGVSPA